MITLEHPSRTLRLSSPSLAQHTHSYSALVRSCPNARTDSSQNGSSLPFYTGTTSSVSTAEKQKSNETSAKDELSFLKEITGNDNAALSTSSSDSGVHDTSISTSESEKEHDLSLEGEREEEKTAIEPLYYRGDGKQDDTEAFSVDQLQEGLQSAMMDRHESSHPPRSNSFGSHQIQTSSSFRLHFGNEDIQPDEDFLCDDWDD